MIFRARTPLKFERGTNEKTKIRVSYTHCGFQECLSNGKVFKLSSQLQVSKLTGSEVSRDIFLHYVVTYKDL